jgi:hypothetical protein
MLVRLKSVVINAGAMFNQLFWSVTKGTSSAETELPMKERRVNLRDIS